ncbi:MAG: amidohydrolase family protein [Chloroflexia bacterium]
MREHAGRLQPGEWVLGGNFDYNRWPERRPSDRAPLDAAAPHNPVALHSRDGHSLWADSRAPQLAGITSDTPDPVGGRIVRGDDGEPTGFLQESAQRAVGRCGSGTHRGPTGPPPRSLPHAHAAGITSIHDFDGRDAREVYRRMHAAGELGLRVYKSLPLDMLDEALEAGYRTGAGDGWLRDGPLKIFTDGALGSHSAALLEPYEGEPDNVGIEVVGPDELAEILPRAARAG